MKSKGYELASRCQREGRGFKSLRPLHSSDEEKQQESRPPQVAEATRLSRRVKEELASRFTRESACGAELHPRPVYLWEQGLGARISSKGVVTYQVHLNNKRRAYATLTEAKQAWEALQATTLPAPSQIFTSDAPRCPSVDIFDLWRVYIRERGNDTRFWRELDARFRKDVLPHLELSKKGIRDVLTSKREYPVAQRTLWEGLSPFMKWMVANDHLPHNPMDGLIPPRVPKSRDRVLADWELSAIWRACKDWSLWGPFFQLLLLTAQRRNEIAGMTYAEVRDTAWTIPGSRTKNGREHIVHLSAPALEIINTKPEFIGRGVSGFSKAKARLDRLSGIDNYRIHDFRRTAATGMASLGVAPHIIERVLNHYQGSVYQRYEYISERAIAIERWSAHLTTIGR